MALTAKKALGAAKKFTKDTVIGLGALKGANLVVDSIVYNDVDMRTEVNVSWTGTDGSSQSGVAYLPYGVGIKSVRLDDAEENFIFTNTDGVDLDPVPLPEVQVKISKAEGNALVQKDDGLYVGETGVKISQEEGNDLVEKSDGLYVHGVSISEDDANIIEERDDGLYVPSLEVSVSDLNDANKLLNIKVGDAVDQSVVIPCKTTVLSANVQQFGSADSVELYKYADGIVIYSQSLIDTDSDGVVVYDQNLRRFGNVKVNDDGLTFTLIGRESEFSFNINPSLVSEPVKLHDEGFNIVLNEANEDYGVYIDINDVVSDITRDEFDVLAEKVAEIELFKFPNAVIKGEPVVNNGQISGFSSSNYLVLPSVFDLAGRGFEFKFAFTTSDDVTLAQNILGSKYCMALYIKDSKLSLRVSSDGVSWDIVNLDGDYTIEANKTYYVKVAFDRLEYKLSISLDDITYDEIGSVTTGDISPKPSELYLGIGNNFNNPFRGILNINKCYLKVNTSIVWQGMDDAGLATRLATDLENIDEVGVAKVKEIAETDDIKAKIAELELFKFPNATIHGVPTINNGQISGFSANNYLAFPFLVDFGERNFVIDMAFTTGSDVTNQQNIIDGKFGLALAIKDSKFVLAISTNGESWDLGAKEGTYTVLPDTNYYLRLSFDHSEYKLSYSLNRESYVDDITVTSSVSPYPVKILIGIGDLDTANPKPFGGIINMNYCYLTINDTVVWRGMDDAGLSTRLSVDLANVDAAGVAKIKDIVSDDLATKVNIQQKVDDAGKVLSIGEDGKVIAKELSIDTRPIEEAVESNWVGGYNLIPYPYKKSDYLPTQFPISISEVEYDVMPDGSIRALGTPIDARGIIIASFKLPAGRYAISGSFDGEFGSRVRLAINGVFSNASSYRGSTGIFELTDESDIDVSLQFLTSDYPVDNYFRPMIVKVNEDGSFPTIFQANVLGNVEITKRLSETPRNDDLAECWNGNGYNLIKFPYSFDQGIVNRGITYNYLDDGSVIADGTASEEIASYVSLSNRSSTIVLEQGVYKITDGVDGTDQTYWTVVYKADSSELCRSSRNNGLFRVVEPTEVFFQIRINGGLSVNNLVFKPMLVKVNEDGTCNNEYSRYALGNTKLTDNLGELDSGLNLLKYGSHGGLNVLDLNKRGDSYFEKTDDDYLTNTVASDEKYFDLVIQTREAYGVYIDLASVRLDESAKSATLNFTIPQGHVVLNIIHRTKSYAKILPIVSNSLSDLNLVAGKPYTLTITCSSTDASRVGGIIITELAIFEGNEAHDFVPYVPSINKMYDFVAGLYPKIIECYTDNHYVYYIKVGSVVIGSLLSQGTLSKNWVADINILEDGLLPRPSSERLYFNLMGGDTTDTERSIYISQDGTLRFNKTIPKTTQYGYNAMFMYDTLD